MKQSLLLVSYAILICASSVSTQLLQYSRSIGFELDNMFLLRDSRDPFASPFTDYPAFESFFIKSEIKLSPTLEYDWERGSASINHWEHQQNLVFQSHPAISFLISRRQQHSNAHITWDKGEELQTSQEDVDYPLGIDYKLTPSPARPASWIRFAGTISDYSESDWRLTLGAGDSALFHSFIVFDYQTNTQNEELRLDSRELKEINPVKANYATEFKQWNIRGGLQFPYISVQSFYAFYKSISNQPDAVYWLADSSRGHHAGILFRWNKRPFHHLSISWQTRFNSAITQGYRSPTDSSIKRFHYMDHEAIFHSGTIKKPWEISKHHQVQFQGTYWYYELSGGSHKTLRRETFNYLRFNPDWFNLYFAALTKNKFDMVEARINIQSWQNKIAYTFLWNEFELDFICPIAYTQIQSNATITFYEPGSPNETTSGLMDGDLLLGSPSFSGVIQLHPLSIFLSLSYTLPLYTELRFKKKTRTGHIPSLKEMINRSRETSIFLNREYWRGLGCH